MYAIIWRWDDCVSADEQEVNLMTYTSEELAKQSFKNSFDFQVTDVLWSADGEEHSEESPTFNGHAADYYFDKQYVDLGHVEMIVKVSAVSQSLESFIDGLCEYYGTSNTIINNNYLEEDI